MSDKTEEKTTTLETTKQEAVMLRFSFQVAPAKGLNCGMLAKLTELGKKLEDAAKPGKDAKPEDEAPIELVNGESELLTHLWGDGGSVLDNFTPRTQALFAAIGSLDEKVKALIKKE